MTDPILVNVGLARNTGGQLDPSTVLRAFRQRGFQHIANALHRSDSEDTVVMAMIQPARAMRAIDELAAELDQDCIAVAFTGNGAGVLIGPKADDWGAFDPSCFILLDGSRAA